MLSIPPAQKAWNSMVPDPIAKEAAALLRQGENQKAIALLTAQRSLSVAAMSCLFAPLCENSLQHGPSERR